MTTIFSTALELGLILSITVLSLFLSYQMLDVCDLSTDGVFTLGAAVGAMVAYSGHPFLSFPAAMLAGSAAGLTSALIQTKAGVDSLLAFIIVNTALYSVNIAVMHNSSLVNLNKTETIFTIVKALLADTFLSSQYKLVIILFFVLLVATALTLFLKTRLGMAIRATGNNRTMVLSSSIDPSKMTIIALVISNSFTALSGCLLGQSQKSVNIDIGSGILTIALASLLIGRILYRSNSPLPYKIFCSIVGAFIFRIIYALALRLKMPAFMLRFISSTIVFLAIATPYLIKRQKEIARIRAHTKEVKRNA